MEMKQWCLGNLVQRFALKEHSTLVRNVFVCLLVHCLSQQIQLTAKEEDAFNIHAIAKTTKIRRKIQRENHHKLKQILAHRFLPTTPKKEDAFGQHGMQMLMLREKNPSHTITN
jgi:hypothetical protein